MKSFYDICNHSMANLGTFPNGLEGLDGTGKYLVMNESRGRKLVFLVLGEA